MQIYEGNKAKYCAAEVNICHGSRYMKDMRKYSPTVEIVDTMRLVNMLFPNLYGLALSVFCNALLFNWIATIYTAANVV